MIAPVLASLISAGAAMVLCCLPGMHVATLFSLTVILLTLGLPVELLPGVAAGLTVGYLFASAIPAVYFHAPDESAFLVVSPARHWRMAGLGHAAVGIMHAGCGLALIVLILVARFLLPRAMPAAGAVLRPHTRWIAGAILLHLVMSEWPRLPSSGRPGPRLLIRAWLPLAGGWMILLLSGLLGMVVFAFPWTGNGTAPGPVAAMFMGLFTMPGLAVLAFADATGAACGSAGRADSVQPSAASSPVLPPMDAGDFIPSTAAGLLGGAMAVLLPGLTGGVGACLAGQAAVLRNRTAFLVCQSAARTVYYAGALLVSCLPGTFARGAAGRLLQPWSVPGDLAVLDMVTVSMAASGALCLTVGGILLTRGLPCLRLESRSRGIGRLGLALTGLLTVWAAGWIGLLAAGTALCIGLLPPLLGTRRMNCLAVILLPVALGGSPLSQWLAAWAAGGGAP